MLYVARRDLYAQRSNSFQIRVQFRRGKMATVERAGGRKENKSLQPHLIIQRTTVAEIIEHARQDFKLHLILIAGPSYLPRYSIANAATPLQRRVPSSHRRRRFSREINPDPAAI